MQMQNFSGRQVYYFDAFKVKFYEYYFKDYYFNTFFQGLESPADGRRSSESSYRIGDNGTSGGTNQTLL